MKGATGHPVRALLFEGNVILDHAHDVGLAFKIVDECLRETHLKRFEKTLERLRSAVDIQLLPQLHNGRATTALILGRLRKSRDVRMIFQQFTDGATQRTCAVAVNNS